MSFKDKFQILRKEKGLSQENLAEILSVSRQAVAKWEAGQSYPDIDNLIKISNYFKISIDKLVKECDEKCTLTEYKPKGLLVNEEIIPFLCKAKKGTYAGKGAETISSRPNSHDLQYTEGNLKYIDTYLGGEKFSGQEALWDNNTPFWSMNYVGRIISEGFSGDFLKEALLLVSEEYPFRGPMIYQNGEYTYHCTVSGDFDWFNGIEEIFYNNRKVYECIFHGGCLK